MLAAAYDGGVRPAPAAPRPETAIYGRRTRAPFSPDGGANRENGPQLSWPPRSTVVSPLLRVPKDAAVRLVELDHMHADVPDGQQLLPQDRDKCLTERPSAR